MIPIKDRIVIKRFPTPKASASGLILTTDGVEPPNMGRVMFIGPEVKDIKVGHIVAVGTKWFTEFKLGAEKFVVLNEPDLIGIIDKDDLAVMGKIYDMKPLMESMGE